MFLIGYKCAFKCGEDTILHGDAEASSTVLVWVVFWNVL